MLPQRAFINQIKKLPWRYWLLFGMVAAGSVPGTSFQWLGCFILLYFSLLYVASSDLKAEAPNESI